MSTISLLLDDIAAQGILGLTVAVADGFSEDGTWELLQERQHTARDPFTLVLVRNPDRAIPHGLNRAIEAVPDGIVIRLDAHGRICPGYIAMIAAAIGDRKDLLVGARVRMVPGCKGVIAEMIATVLNTVIGSGGTASRGELQQPLPVAHTVMSCWHRAVWLGNGGYDESLLSNEDFAFDWMAGCRGCTVLALPQPEYLLKARPSLTALCRQRWRYGWWKAVVVRRYPRSIHLRQAIPLLMLISSLVLAIVAPVGLAALAAAWLLMIWTVVLSACPRRSVSAIILAPTVALVVQFVWAAGLAIGLILHLDGCPRPGARVPARGNSEVD